METNQVNSSYELTLPVLDFFKKPSVVEKAENHRINTCIHRVKQLVEIINKIDPANK